MKFKGVIQAVSLAGAGVLMMAASANADSITFATNGTGTLFVGPNDLVLDSSSGAFVSLARR